MIAQDIEFAAQLVVAQAREEVACIAILSDEAQGFALASPADQNGRMGLLYGARRVQGSFKRIVLAGIGLLIALPHLERYLQRLL